ncbi:MAG: hypothetical protein MZW92_30635 [Comamonadaceae bacterium]|nr:hypothetical protein [Comamonadaceae bacterium]
MARRQQASGDDPADFMQPPAAGVAAGRQDAPCNGASAMPRPAVDRAGPRQRPTTATWPSWPASI